MNIRLRLCLLIVAWGLLCAPFLPAQSKRPEDLASGKLLVTPRDGRDPNFAETVVLLVKYAPEGGFGLVINRRTKAPISEALSQIKGSGKYSDPVFMGGPVQIGAVLALLSSKTEPKQAERVFANTYLINTVTGLEAALEPAKNPSEFRVYFGYCGWGPGQLDAEVKRGDWYIFDSSEKSVFDSDPATLWSRLIARTELHIASLR